MTEFQQYGGPKGTLHERCFPHRLMEGIWMWSVYSEEKALFFNGFLIQTADHGSIIVDPPCGGPEVLDAFQSLPRPTLILVTNRDHERASALFADHFNVPIYASEMDGPLMEHAPDKTYQDGDVLPGGWQAIQLTQQKSPGESVFYHLERRIAILGDALIGSPNQRLSMLPADRYVSRREAIQGLQRLKKLDIKTVLTADGDPILQEGSALIAEALLEASRTLMPQSTGV